MKKLFTLIVAVAITVSTTNAAFTDSKTETKKSYNTFASTEQKAAAEFFVKLSRKDYELLSGKQLGIAERLTFKLAQKNVKRQLKRAEEETEGFNIGGFALGFFGSIIGLLLAYVLSQDKNFRRWAWWGFRASLLIIGIILLVALGAS